MTEYAELKNSAYKKDRHSFKGSTRIAGLYVIIGGKPF